MQWAQVNNKLRNAFAAAVTIEPKGHYDYFQMELHDTDTLHPWGTDASLCRLTHDKDLQQANFNEVADSATECIYEMGERLDSWLSDPMNHPPGYQLPTKLHINYDLALDQFLDQLLESEKI